MPAIVLSTTGADQDATTDPDFLLQRRVIEISDGLLALRPCRSQLVREAASRMSRAAGKKRAAFVEAAITKAALAARQAVRLPETVAPPAAGATHPKTSLRDDTEWLRQVARAYAQHMRT